MRTVLSLLICISAVSCLAGEIVNVRVETTYDDQVVVRYDLIDATGLTYDVKLEVYDENKEYKFAEPKTYTGDIGTGIRPNRDLRITWDALQDINSLTGVYVFNIVATRESNSVVYIPPGSTLKPGGTPTKPRTGDPRTGAFGQTKDFLNGDFMNIGFSSHKFINPAFESNEAAGAIKHQYGFEGSWGLTRLPGLLVLSGFYHEYQAISVRLADSSVKYYGGDIALSVCPLPFVKYVTPTVGAGYRLAYLSGHTYDTSNVAVSSRLNVSSFFYQAGLQISIPWEGNIKWANRIIVGAEYKHSMANESRKWQQIIVYVGLGGRPG